MILNDKLENVKWYCFWQLVHHVMAQSKHLVFTVTVNMGLACTLYRKALQTFWKEVVIIRSH